VLPIRPDYTLSDGGDETVESKAAELYLQVCYDAVLQGKYLDFLAWDTTKNPELATAGSAAALPSWALDWTHDSPKEQFDLLQSERWNSAKSLAFGADIFANTTSSPGPRRTVLASISRHIDMVVKVGKTGSQVGHCRKALCENWHSVTGLRDSADAGDQLYPAGGTWGEAWWNALLLMTDDFYDKEKRRSRLRVSRFCQF